MRVDAVNSFLSARPIMGLPPVSHVSGNSATELLPETKRNAEKPFVRDTIGKAQARPQPRLAPSELSSYEEQYIRALMVEQRAKERSLLLHTFPGLLRV